MINLNQNNIALPFQPSPEMNLIGNGDPGGGDLENLFTAMLSGAMNNNPMLADELSGENSEFTANGESVLNLQALLDQYPELDGQIPQDLLMQFVKSGGKDHESLEAFLQQATGQAVDLEAELPQNLNQVLATLELQGVETKAVVQSIEPKLLNDKGIELKVNANKGRAQGELRFVSTQGAEAQKQAMLSDGQQQSFQQQNGEHLKHQFMQSQSQGKGGNDKLIDVVNQALPEETKALLESFDKEMLKDDHFKQQLKNMLANTQTQSSSSPQTTQQVIASASQQAKSPGLAPFTKASPDSPILVRPLQVMTPVGQGVWAQQFNEQVVWLGSQQIKAAAIKIAPAELGPVEVNIKVVNDVANVQINSHSGQVRDLIEQAMPRLREMMQDQGLQLGNFDVQDNSEQHAMRKQQNGNGDKEGGLGSNVFFDDVIHENNDSEVQVSEVVRQVKQGLVDYFA